MSLIRLLRRTPQIRITFQGAFAAAPCCPSPKENRAPIVVTVFPFSRLVHQPLLAVNIHETKKPESSNPTLTEASRETGQPEPIDNSSQGTFSEEMAHFRKLALRGRKKGLHSSGTIRCIELAEWLWRMAPGFANTDYLAVQGFVRLVELSASAPQLVREILQEGIVDENGKEVAP